MFGVYQIVCEVQVIYSLLQINDEGRAVSNNVSPLTFPKQSCRISGFSLCSWTSVKERSSALTQMCHWINFPQERQIHSSHDCYRWSSQFNMEEFECQLHRQLQFTYLPGKVRVHSKIIQQRRMRQHPPLSWD